MTPNNRFTLTRRQLAAIISRLNRSRAGQASAGTFLENMSKLLQVLAIVVAGVWVLIDYFEFKNRNNELINTQLALSVQAAKLAQSGAVIANQLNQLKLQHSSTETIRFRQRVFRRPGCKV